MPSRDVRRHLIEQRLRFSAPRRAARQEVPPPLFCFQKERFVTHRRGRDPQRVGPGAGQDLANLSPPPALRTSPGWPDRRGKQNYEKRAPIRLERKPLEP